MSDTAELSKLYAERDRRKRERLLEFYRPYPKQLEFHSLGATKHERALIAGNRTGKSYSVAAEMAMHLTGLYPEWWEGRKFTKAIHAWAAGVTGLAVRDTMQKHLFGKPGVVEELGSGLVPKDRIGKASSAHGYANLYDTVQVRHVSGAISTVVFKSYEQGREKFQGDAVDLIWLDEECEPDVYSECLTRTATTSGLMMCSFTPLNGKTDVVIKFMEEDNPHRAFVTMTIDDADHIPPEEKARLIASWPKHERAARARGEPFMGAGRIFETDEDALMETAIAHVPPHWYKLWAIDFGTDHPFAAVLLLHDRDADVIHVHHCIRTAGTRPIDHAALMRPLGPEIPVAWPHDGHIKERGSVQPVMRLYKEPPSSLKILPSHAAFPDGSISTEGGIMLMDDRMKAGKFKVARHLTEWFEEYRGYHRRLLPNGSSEIVKKRDDLMSATRIGCMTIRSAKQVGVGVGATYVGGALRNEVRIAKDVDYNPFEYV